MTAEELAKIPRRTANEVLLAVALGPGVETRQHLAVEVAMNEEWWRGFHAALDDEKLALIRMLREEYRQKMNACTGSAARAFEEEDLLKAAVQAAEAARMETVFLTLNKVISLLE